jgi:hypothetical protein
MCRLRLALGHGGVYKKSAERCFATTIAFLPDDSVVNVDTHRAMIGPHDVIADERAPDKWHCSR